MATARVRAGGVARTLEPGESLTFGRARDCDLCLDADDVAISRIAGSIEHQHGTWWVTNRSTTRPLALVDDLGLRSVLAPGRRAAVEAPTKVLVDGTVGNHTVHIAVDAVGPEPDVATPPPGTETAIGEEVLITPADRAAMIALFAGYLEEPPRYDPYPKSYAAAAARLGWPRTTLVKRIEYLRTRLTSAGVPNLTGFNALNNLAEYALTRGLITKADFALLQR